MKSSMLLSQLTMYKKVRMHYLFLEMPKIRITNIQIFFLLSKNCQICTTTSQCVLCGAHTRYVYRKRILVRRSTNENELFFSSSINHNVYPRVSYVFIIYYIFFCYNFSMGFLVFRFHSNNSTKNWFRFEMQSNSLLYSFMISFLIFFFTFGTA